MTGDSENRTLTLLDGPSDDATAYKHPVLTDRQRLALEYVGAHQPVAAVELGAVLHEDRAARGGKGHSAAEHCAYCSDEGRAMGRALRAKGLVQERRGAGWVLKGARPEHSRPDHSRCYDPATAPLPEGF